MAKRTNSHLEKIKKYRKINPGIFVVKYNIIFCNICSVKLKVNRKSNITQHLNTKSHLQRTTTSTENKVTTLHFAKNSIVEILCNIFLGANIPLHKMRNFVLLKMFGQLNIVPSCETRIKKEVDSMFKSSYN